MYLSAAAIAAMENVRRPHFLDPTAVRLARSIGDAAGLKNIGVHINTVEPGCRATEFHAHRYEEECLYILSGRGTTTLGDTKQRVGPGDFIGHPIDGVAHEMVNDGDEPLVYLVIGQRLPQEIVDYPRIGKRMYRHGGERNIVQVKDIQTMKV